MDILQQPRLTTPRPSRYKSMTAGAGMRRVRKLLRLSGAERRLLVAAVVVVAAVRLGLWLFPFRIFRPILARVTSRPHGPGADERTVERVVWAVSTAAARVPNATCLTQALAAQVLLARLGERATLRIGVARDERLGVRGHAWLEHRGKVVIGGASLDGYVPLSLSDEQWAERCLAATAARQTEI